MSDCKPLAAAALESVVERARDFVDSMAARGWRREDSVIVFNDRTQGFSPAGLSAYKATAWDEPATPPLLPWGPPAGHVVGRVAADGVYVPLCAACQPVPAPAD